MNLFPVYVGNTIRFKSPTRHTNKVAQRKVTSLLEDYSPRFWAGVPVNPARCNVTVRFEGSSNFHVLRHEIIEVIS